MSDLSDACNEAEKVVRLHGGGDRPLAIITLVRSGETGDELGREVWDENARAWQSIHSFADAHNEVAAIVRHLSEIPWVTAETHAAALALAACMGRDAGVPSIAAKRNALAWSGVMALWLAVRQSELATWRDHFKPWMYEVV